MESIIMNMKITRSTNNDVVKFVVPELSNLSINITDSGTQDIEKIFNVIFEEIVKNRKLIKFELHDTENDLFNEIACDLVLQLNDEIKNSESDFKKIIELNDK